MRGSSLLVWMSMTGPADQLYVLGGGTSFSADRFEDLPTFNIAERRWFYTRTKADLTTTIDLVSVPLLLLFHNVESCSGRARTGIPRHGGATARCRSATSSGYSEDTTGMR